MDQLNIKASRCKNNETFYWVFVYTPYRYIV